MVVTRRQNLEQVDCDFQTLLRHNARWFSDWLTYYFILFVINKYHSFTVYTFNFKHIQNVIDKLNQ